MRVIILGSNGYLGQNLTIDCLLKGYQVYGYDIQQQSLLQTADGQFQYRPIDITSTDSVASVDWNADVLYFFAGATGTRVSIEQAASYVQINETGLIHVVQELQRQKASPRIVFPSTRLVYEGRPGMLAEDDAKCFKTVYAVNKFACEQLLDIYSRYYGLEYTVFRICVPFGSLGTADYSYGTIGFMIKQARQGVIRLYGDGSQQRSFTHVGDICNQIAGALEHPVSRNTVFNIGGEAFSLRTVADLIAVKMNAVVELVPWPEVDLQLESGDTVFDDSRLRTAINYSLVYHMHEWVGSL